MRRVWILMLVLLLLMGSAAAYTVPEDLAEQDLETVLTAYMEQNGLNKGNFSFSYYNTVTGEAYAYNDKAFMVAASTFKLPLNMYYYELERDGEIEPDAYIPEAGDTLDDIHELSLVLSNNEVSIGILYHLGDFATYKTILREKYFTMPEEEIDYIYYADNYYCTHMMMDALKYLYDHSEDFEEMLGYMKQAQPGEYFRAGVTEYEVAHKYGWYDGAVNDVGIIYTDEPFLLAVYTYGTYEGVVADVAKLVTAYNVAHTTPVEEPEPEPEAPAEEPELPDMEQAVTLEVEMVPLEQPEEEELRPEAPEEEPEEAPEPEAPAEEPESARPLEWWMIAVALGVFLLGGGGTLLIFNNKRLQKLYPETEEEDD